MKGEIVTEIQTVRLGSRVSEILHDGRVTKCNSYLRDCGNFQYETHVLKKGQVRIGLCKLTAVACLRIARIIALGLSSADTQPNQT